MELMLLVYFLDVIKIIVGCLIALAIRDLLGRVK